MDIKKKIHTKLVNAARSLGKTHNKCSIPGCQGYEPAQKKGFLEDSQSFFALKYGLPKGFEQAVRGQ